MRTAHVKFVVHKRFGRARCLPISAEPGSIIDGIAAVGSTDAYDSDGSSDQSERSGYEMAPSYSFAILMKSAEQRSLANGKTLIRSRSTFARSVIRKYASIPHSNTFHTILDHGAGNGKPEELVPLVDPIPKPVRVAPPANYPMSRLRRLPKVVMVTDEDTVHENIAATTYRNAHYVCNTNRVILLDNEEGVSISDVIPDDAPPPSYREVLGVRSMSTRLSQIFYKIRGSQQSLIGDEL